jgi:hypothetical protein
MQAVERCKQATEFNSYVNGFLSCRSFFSWRIFCEEKNVRFLAFANESVGNSQFCKLMITQLFCRLIIQLRLKPASKKRIEEPNCSNPLDFSIRWRLFSLQTRRFEAKLDSTTTLSRKPTPFMSPWKGFLSIGTDVMPKKILTE